MRRSSITQNVLLALLACAWTAGAQEPASISVAEVNRILRSPTETRSRSVVFRGVVIHWAHRPRGAYVQADGVGVFVRFAPPLQLPALGDELEVIANASFTGAGSDTEIDAQSVRVLGHPGLPGPLRCTLAESGTGKFNRLAVEGEGVVLHVSRHYGAQWLTLSDATGVAMLGIYSWPEGWKADSLLGKPIRFRGLSSGVWHMALRCSTPDEITVLDTAPVGALPALTSVEALRAADTTKAAPVVLRGTCTYLSPSRKFFQLHDGRAEIAVNSPRFDPGGKLPRTGEEAVISGVVAWEEGQPRIDGWSVATIGPGKLPSPPAEPARISARRRTVREVQLAPPSRDRISLAGVVTFARQAGTLSAFSVEDATGAAWVYGADPISGPRVPQPGDRVEIEGVRSVAPPGAVQILEAVWRVTGRDKLPPASRIAMMEALSGAFDAKRVLLRGRVVAYETHLYRDVHVSRIWLREGEVATYGNFLGSEFASEPAKPGQLVELEGVCVATPTGPGVVRTFAVQLNRMSDARVLPEPPPWHDPTTRRLGIGAGGALVAAGAWVFFLRRQVRARTASLAASEEELRASLTREQEISRLKTAFISMVSHEFRTPLNIIATSCDILARYLDRLTAEERAEHLASIQKSSLRMAGMMEDVLLLGRLEAGRQKLQPQEMHLPAWCRRFVDEMLSATSARCPIELTLGEFDPVVRADENILRHILANLLSNAAKYSASGEPVKFSVTRDRTDAIFRVEDRGIGIPEADRARLFEAFQRASNVGTINGAGLGLVVVKRGAELHGGTVEFTSTEGKGTAFTVRLPLFSDPS